MTKQETQQEALARAVSGQSVANYAPIFQAFIARGIPESEIKPRENVFMFHAWRALGRTVRLGEHGIKIVTFIDCVSKEADEKTGEPRFIAGPGR